jgi:hypothetical protein
MRAQPAGDRQDNGVGGKVAGENPLAIIDRSRQATRDIAQRHDRDRGVEHLHERRHNDDHGYQPWVPRHMGSGGRKRRDCHLFVLSGLWGEPVVCD